MGTRARCWRILYVEDHADTLAVTCKFLRRGGHTVVGVDSCAAARAAAAEGERFDLLIVDVILGDGDGLAMLSELRRRYAIAGIVLSAQGYDVDLIHSYEAGFAAHLVKPIHFEDLAAAIGEALPDSDNAGTLAEAGGNVAGSAGD